MRAQGGYLRPEINGLVKNGAEISACCPAVGLRAPKAPEGAFYDPLWGPYLQMQRGWARDAGLRFAGASGGALSAVLQGLLAQGRVDAVLQTAADPENPLGARAVLTFEAADLHETAGSRYCPTSPLNGLFDALEQAQTIAFVGKPCDVAALQALINLRPELRARIPYILSFFCAGVPSAQGTAALARKMGADPAQITGFRYRGNGWPGAAVARLGDGSERALSYAQSWGEVLSKHLQTRCKLCADGTGRAADLVFGDAWEADENGYPRFTDAQGQSLIVTRSARGAEALGCAEIDTAPFDAASLKAIQPGQRERRRALAARLAALMLLRRPYPTYRGMALLACARQNPAQRNLKAFLGMLKRAWRTT